MRRFALAAALIFAIPPGPEAVVDFVEDQVDIPYIHDCHGLHPHASECGRGPSRPTPE
jgi:hypothetical protein